MNALSIVLLVVLVAGVALGAYALLAPQAGRARVRPAAARDPAPLAVTVEWTTQAGEEFAGLAESERCDLIFAVAALDDERSHRLLVHALGDPSGAVALAAAHALRSAGHHDDIDRFVRDHAGARADALLRDLLLLE